MKTRSARAKRKGVKAGGEAPCKRCRTITVKVKRDRKGRFSKR